MSSFILKQHYVLHWQNNLCSVHLLAFTFISTWDVIGSSGNTSKILNKAKSFREDLCFRPHLSNILAEQKRKYRLDKKKKTEYNWDTNMFYKMMMPKQWWRMKHAFKQTRWLHMNDCWLITEVQSLLNPSELQEPVNGHVVQAVHVRMGKMNPRACREKKEWARKQESSWGRDRPWAQYNETERVRITWSCDDGSTLLM